MSKDIPIGPDGQPMASVVGSVKDTVPTVQYGSIQIFAAVTRPVPNGTDEELINETRRCIRIAEVAVGCERYLLQCAIDPSKKFIPPQTNDQYAQPPAGYDPQAALGPHPAETMNVANNVPTTPIVPGG